MRTDPLRDKLDFTGEREILPSAKTMPRHPGRRAEGTRSSACHAGVEPPDRNTEAGPRAVAASDQRTSEQRILLVDDDFFIRDLVSQILLRAGYEVDAAADGEAGWEALTAKTYDLLITDQEMPGMRGLELVEALRSAGMVLPVILISGSFNLDELTGNRGLNLQALLAKPFTSEQLLQTVKKHLHPHVAVTEPCAANAA